MKILNNHREEYHSPSMVLATINRPLLHVKISITVVALSSILLLLYTLFDRTHVQKSKHVLGKCPTRVGKCPDFGTRKLWCRTRIRASVVSDTWNTGHGPYLEVSCYLD